jgi:hypothetical protein
MGETVLRVIECQQVGHQIECVVKVHEGSVSVGGFGPSSPDRAPGTGASRSGTPSRAEPVALEESS